MSPTERLAFCRGDAVANDAAEAAELQCWLVANARHLRPVAHSGLMAWALAALQAQSAWRQSLDTVRGEQAALSAEQKELAKLAQDRINDLVGLLGAARVQLQAQQGLIERMHERLRKAQIFGFDKEIAALNPPTKACGGCGNACSEVRP